MLRGGVPGVRQAIEQMNVKAAAEGMPKIKAEPLVALAEKLAPRLKSAEWRDRADAALAGIDVIDIKDLRSVVVAADSGARDDESRALADQVREGLAARVDAEHRRWLDELAQAIADGRTVRALRHSSRPPKAGAPLPPDMAERLAALASASLTSEITQDRWATVLDAVAFSPVRAQVTPAGRPENPGDQLLAAVRKLAGKVPDIAASFGVVAPAPRSRGARRTRRRLRRRTRPRRRSRARDTLRRRRTRGDHPPRPGRGAQRHQPGHGRGDRARSIGSKTTTSCGWASSATKGRCSAPVPT
ncbi:MAG: hypothetical protein R2695_12495 [Acidimicrobiales bacterium]